MITIGFFLDGEYTDPAEMPLSIKQTFINVCGDRYAKADPLTWDGNLFLVVNAMCYMSIYYELEEYPDAIYVLVDSKAASMHLDTLRQIFPRITFTLEKINSTYSVVCLSSLSGEWRTYVYRALLLTRLLSPQFVQVCQSMPVYGSELNDDTLCIWAKQRAETLGDCLLQAAMAGEDMSTDDFPGRSHDVCEWLFVMPNKVKRCLPGNLSSEAVHAAVYALVIQRVMPLLCTDSTIETNETWEGEVVEGFTSEIDLSDIVLDTKERISTISRVVYHAPDGTETRFVKENGVWFYE